VLLALLLLLIGAGVGFALARQTPTGRAAFNVVEYRVRSQWLRWFGERDPGQDASGGISGVVRDQHAQPLQGALVLIASDKGVSYASRTDELGTYRLEGVPPARYVPVASLWGYHDSVYRQGRQERTPIAVRSAELQSSVDFVLTRREPWRPTLDSPPTLGPSQRGAALFPAEVYASRVPVTFTNEGLVITTTLIYEPEGVETSEKLPLLVASYPSEPMNWDRVSVAIASEGYLVLASGPSPQRGLDIPGLGRDLLQSVAYLRSGQLLARADTEREGWLSGSFSSIILYQALQVEPGGVDALVVVGGISDALLGVGALYEEVLEIPPKYATAIASLGRPDRYPEIYLGYSPVYHAEHLPPTLVVHTTADEVIPPNQAERFGEALAAAGVAHELFLYEDTTHYLDQVNVTPDTAELYGRLTQFLDTHVRHAAR
jgi:fermentation-respiration switch protein FrsA (DUF1100 family)